MRRIKLFENFINEKLSADAQEFVSKKIAYLKSEEGMDDAQAAAVAYSYARKAGYKIPKKK